MEKFDYLENGMVRIKFFNGGEIPATVAYTFGDVEQGFDLQPKGRAIMDFPQDVKIWHDTTEGAQPKYPQDPPL